MQEPYQVILADPPWQGDAGNFVLDLGGGFTLRWSLSRTIHRFPRGGSGTARPTLSPLFMPLRTQNTPDSM